MSNLIRFLVTVISGALLLFLPLLFGVNLTGGGINSDRLRSWKR